MRARKAALRRSPYLASGLPPPPMTEPAAPRGARTVALPEELARAIETRIRGSAFDSVDAFVAFVLSRLVEEPGPGAFSEEDERQLKERLRSLGYID